jgi:hypothetical protein
VKLKKNDQMKYFVFIISSLNYQNVGTFNVPPRKVQSAQEANLAQKPPCSCLLKVGTKGCLQASLHNIMIDNPRLHPKILFLFAFIPLS